jgi:hypothetical protein
VKLEEAESQNPATQPPGFLTSVKANRNIPGSDAILPFRAWKTFATHLSDGLHLTVFDNEVNFAKVPDFGQSLINQQNLFGFKNFQGVSASLIRW